MTTDLIAAVARLREWINLSPETQAMLDIDCVLSALDAAQADARQATETLTQIRNSTYRNAVTLRAIAARALDAAIGEGDAQTEKPAPSVEPRDACHHLRQKWRLDMRSGICVDCGALITNDGVCAPSAEPPAADDLAADPIERLRAERDYMKRQRDRHIGSVRSMEHVQRGLIDRAERAEAERDALRECVRAMIEWMDHPVPTPDELWTKMKDALDAARAKVGK